MAPSPVARRSPVVPVRLWGVVALLIGGGGCASSGSADDGPMGSDGEWEVLFDGSDLSAWRGVSQDAVPNSWRIEDGALYFAPGEERGDVVTRETYGDFELALEWKISDCGNSGIFYRGDPEVEPWRTSSEMQVLDDACHPDSQYPSHRAGANYDLYMATPGVVRPAGEWNAVRIVARGPHVEHWLNGQKVVEYEQGSPSWRARVAASKFRTFDGYGQHLDGPIALQDHDDPVWYRNVRIRRL